MTTAEGPTLAAQADMLLERVTNLSNGIVVSNEEIARSNVAIAESNDRITELGSYGRRNRHIIKGLVLSVVLDIMLTFLFAIAVAKAQRASDRVATVAAANRVLSISNHANALAACEALNAQRASDIVLFTYVIDHEPAPTTLAEANALATQRARVTQAFAQRVCS